MKLQQKIALAGLVWLLSCNCSFGLTVYQQLVRELRSLSSDELSYNYSVRLLTENKKVVDSVDGRLVRIKNSFLDSNRYGVQILSHDYFCQLKFDERTALVTDIGQLRKRLDVPSLGEFSVPAIDSFLLQPGTLNVDTTNIVYYKLKWKSAGLSQTVFTLWVRKAQYKIERFDIETEETYDVENRFTRRCSVFNISNQVSGSWLNASRFFDVNDGIVRLAPKYKNYTLKIVK